MPSLMFWGAALPFPFPFREICLDISINEEVRRRIVARGARLPRGLPNPTSWCYLVSIVQAISSLAEFRVLLAGVEPPSRGSHPRSSWGYRPGQPDGCVASLLRIIDWVNSEGAYVCGYKSLDSQLLHDVASLVQNLSRSGEQQDVQEAYLLLLDEIRGCLGRKFAGSLLSFARSSFNTLFYPRFGVSPAALWHLQQLRSESVFIGLIRRHSYCFGCGTTSSYTFDEFNLIDVQLFTFFQAPAVTLERCLAQFVAPDAVDGVECFNCTKIAALRSIEEQIDAFGAAKVKARLHCPVLFSGSSILPRSFALPVADRVSIIEAVEARALKTRADLHAYFSSLEGDEGGDGGRVNPAAADALKCVHGSSSISSRSGKVPVVLPVSVESYVRPCVKSRKRLHRTICRAPSVLCIFLNRLYVSPSGELVKVRTRVYPRLVLDIAAYSSTSSSSSSYYYPSAASSRSVPNTRPGGRNDVAGSPPGIVAPDSEAHGHPRSHTTCLPSMRYRLRASIDHSGRPH
eukprot:GHVU01210100.1.p1 GENE.GHVU01210100.1~~GHVU01210100.1.p1  ORF type:complete len:516 (-),score=19.48 GHVU01210100.1:488-2035(-)